VPGVDAPRTRSAVVSGPGWLFARSGVTVPTIFEASAHAALHPSSVTPADHLRTRIRDKTLAKRRDMALYLDFLGAPTRTRT
jgi:hypothetical protein